MAVVGLGWVEGGNRKGSIGDDGIKGLEASVQ